MSNNLVPQPITDKNGVTKMHWIKSDAVSSSAGENLIPAPAAPPLTDKQRALILEAEIDSLLPDYEGVARDLVQGAVRLNNLELLQVFLNNVESGVPLSVIDDAYLDLEDREYENLVSLITPERVASKLRIEEAINRMEEAKGGWDYESTERIDREHRDLYCFAMSVDDTDRALIEQIISTRDITDLYEVQETLADMKQVQPALASGVL